MKVLIIKYLQAELTEQVCLRLTCWVHEPWRSLCVPSLPSAVLSAAWPPKTHIHTLQFHIKWSNTVLINKQELMTHIFGRWSRNFNPGLRKEGTGSQHEYNVDHCMDRVIKHRTKRLRRRQIVTQTAYRVGTSRTTRWCILQQRQKIDFRKVFFYIYFVSGLYPIYNMLWICNIHLVSSAIHGTLQKKALVTLTDQVPRRLTRKLPLKRVESIWEMT